MMTGSVWKRLWALVLPWAAVAHGCSDSNTQPPPDEKAPTPQKARHPLDEGKNGLRPLRERSSLLGVHRWYQQTYRGLDVLGGGLARHVYFESDARVSDRRHFIRDDLDVTPSVSQADALTAAGPFATTASLAVDPGPTPRLVWAVDAEPPTGTTRTLVDAQSGQILSVKRIAQDLSGSGRVFNPSPTVTLQDQSLTDQDDADYPALEQAYRMVALTHLDGSGYLRGDFARIDLGDDKSAFSSSNSFLYGRSSTFFSQTMAYYHVTTAQEYIQSLGFFDVNNEPQLLFPDAFPFDQSFYSPTRDTIFLGSGGVDDAEDADVILHEYGHAIQDAQVPGFGSGEDAAAIGEGFSDYWAVTMSQPVNGGYEVPCMGDWDSASSPVVPHCLTRTDLDLTVRDRVFEPHYDGQIWSRALWDINQKLGRDITDTIVLESHFAFTPSVTFEEGALLTVDTARRLFGNPAARAAHDAFSRRGLIPPPSARRATPMRRQGPPGLRQLARLDEPAPGGGFLVSDFEPYDLDDQGAALYAANDIESSGEIVFLDGRTYTTQLLRSGNPAPGGGELGLGVVPGPSIGAGGEVAAGFFLDPFRRPWGRNAGLYRIAKEKTTAVVVPSVTPAPTGGAFQGVADMTSINESGAIAFNGMIATTAGISGTLGMGVFLASSENTITKIAAPGDPAPGGTFDYTAEPAMNLAGDIVFGGHLAGTPCQYTRQSVAIGCVRDLFLRRASTGSLERIAAVGQPAPGGGEFFDLRYPVINQKGDVLFRAVVSDGGSQVTGYYLIRNGQILKVARPGDPMPGGGNFVGTALQPGNWDLNNRGDVAFSASLDSFDNIYGQYGFADQGLYIWTDGTLSLVARSGMVVPGGGEIFQLLPPEFIGFEGSVPPFSGAPINNARQVLFQAAVVRDDGFLDGVLYLRE